MKNSISNCKIMMKCPQGSSFIILAFHQLLNYGSTDTKHHLDLKSFLKGFRNQGEICLNLKPIEEFRLLLQRLLRDRLRHPFEGRNMEVEKVILSLRSEVQIPLLLVGPNQSNPIEDYYYLNL